MKIAIVSEQEYSILYCERLLNSFKPLEQDGIPNIMFRNVILVSEKYSDKL